MPKFYPIEEVNGTFDHVHLVLMVRIIASLLSFSTLCQLGLFLFPRRMMWLKFYRMSTNSLPRDIKMAKEFHLPSC